jgi:Fe-S-cluster-containing dehydrogenase component
VAERTGARVIYPFDGPPYPPFLEWAGETGHASPSPLDKFIHHQHGLWHAYRFSLEFAHVAENVLAEDFRARQAPSSPCASCSEKPCLTACPVDAFAQGKYDVDRCMVYLNSDEDSDCRRFGCVARMACPVGPENRYIQDHAQFHMQAFVSRSL